MNQTKSTQLPATIMICDDEQLIRWSLSEHLKSQGYQTIEASDGMACIEAVSRNAPSLIIMDLKMEPMDGLTALRKLRAEGHKTPVVILTAYGDVETAIEATQLGAADYLHKPFDLREVTRIIRRVLRENRLRLERNYHRQRERVGYGDFVGRAPSMEPVFDLLKRLEGVEAPTVLITGESGTGKDVIARAIHHGGPRKGEHMVDIDCASFPEQLIESGLFGHERGAFTDARSLKQGLFEVAGRGTVFLDEIGEMPLPTQARLLRVLESRRFMRVGGTRSIALHAGLIAATNRNLREEVAKGRFREDLFHRLYIIPIHIPPLRERREDIPLLVDYFLERLTKTCGRKIDEVTANAMRKLMNYSWPGNVRELRNLLERVVILGRDDVLDLEDLPPELRYERFDQGEANGNGDGGCPFVLPQAGVDLGGVERSLIRQALDRSGGNQSAAARMLGITRFALRYRVEKHGIVD